MEKYNTAKQMLAKNTQQQYETAYVNQQLMDKYLKQNLAQQGLADSGIANLYAQQNNTNYMNQRADIAKTNMLAEQELYDKYTQDVQKREDDIYNLAIGKIDKSLNNNGYLSDSSRIELEDYFKGLGLSEDRTGLLNQYMDMYKPTEEQIKIAEYAPYYDYEAEKFYKDVTKNIGSNGKITSEKAEQLLTQLDSVRDQIGEAYYKDYKASIMSLTETNEDIKKNQSDQETTKIQNKNKVLQKYGVDTTDRRNIVDMNSINSRDGSGYEQFGEFANSGMQRNWIKEVINKAKNNEIKDGTLIDMNYGVNATGKGDVWVYYDGKFYKTNRHTKEADMHASGFAEKGIWDWIF